MATHPGMDFEEQVRQHLPGRLRTRIDRLDERATRFMQEYGITLLRLALAVVYIWFGALKIVDRSPVKALIADTAPWADTSWLLPVLGVWEVIIGLGLIFPVVLRLTLLLFWLQLAGTFLVFITAPGHAFQDDNPLLLSDSGEFVLKNLVLISAGLVVGSTLRRRRAAAARARR